MGDKRKVGFIGLGDIGKPMAKHLVCEQFDAYVFDLVPAAVLAARNNSRGSVPSAGARAMPTDGVMITSWPCRMPRAITFTYD